MAKLIDLDGLAYFYGKIKAMLAEKLGKNDTAAAAIHDADGNNISTTYAKKTDITNITVDSSLSSTSTNPIQNKAVKTAIDTVTASIPTKVSTLENDAGYLTQHQSLDDYAKKTDVNTALADKLGINDTAAAAIKDGAGNTISTTYTSKADVSALLSTKLGVTATAYAAARDGAGNNIVNTYAKKTDIPSAYTLPNATSSTLGGVKIGSNISVSSGTISITKSNVTSALGYTPPTSDTVYDNATTTTAGLMSASDKAKLNGIADNANNYIHPPTHPAGMITGLATVATSGSYNDLKNKPTIPAAITVDAELSDTSTNPVQNKVVKTNMDSLYNNLMTKLNMYRSELPTKVSDLENDAGYLTQHQSLDGYAKTSVDNLWTAQQNFHDLILSRERYTTFVVTGSDTPTTSTMLYTTTGAFTLSLGTLAGALSAGQSSVFTAYFAANADYTLTITNAGTIKYIGSASDVAITSAGLLLNIMMLKDNSGNLTSIVQASKLS